METAWEILLWLVLILGITFIAVIWGIIVIAVSSVCWNFIKTYRKVSKEIDEEEAADDGPQYKF
ncbi:membrane protein [Gordonia phage Runhaar]|nr:membrane protein [Gordonia phage Runhaar]QZD97831.1 membrane protein [Gordonia phage Nadmeg]